MALTRERFAEFLNPYIHSVYEEIVEQGDDLVGLLFGVEKTDLAEERVTGIGGLGLMQPWNGQVYYDDVEPLWTKVYRVEKYSIGLKIERELWEDAQHAEVKERVQRFALSIHRTRQVHAHLVFNDAFTGAFLKGPDGQPLCSGAHPLSPSKSDKTQSNVMNAELSLEALEEARLRMLNWTDDRGNKILRVPDTLLVPPTLALKARELIESPERPDTADRAINVRRGAYRIVELPLLDSSKAWFLVDSKTAKLYLKWFEKRKPVPERDEDFDTETLKWKAVARYAFGFHHWSWIIGSNPA